MTLPASAQRVLVMELAGLGDNVHLLPALWLVRRQWPNAQLHVMAHSHVADLFKVTPWVDRVWRYPASPKPQLAENLRWAKELREQAFDVLINTTGSDRSSMIAWGSRVKVRIGRRPADGGPPGWPLLFTHVVEEPYYQEPMYLQKWKSLRSAGFDSLPKAPEFHVEIDPALRRAAGINPVDEGTYVHVSPFTTADQRELPANQVVEVMEGLRARYPQLRTVVSCAPNERERTKLNALLLKLRQPPWRVFPGTLEVHALAAVVEKSALNLCGDTGTLHLSMMCQAPAVAWFRSHKGEKEWIPQGPQYRVLISEGGAAYALHGISTAAILGAADEVLAARAART